MYNRGYERYTRRCIPGYVHPRYTRRCIPGYVHPRVYQEVYTTLCTPYHPGYTTVPPGTPSGMLSVLHVRTSPGDEALGSEKEKPVGERENGGLKLIKV